MYIYHSEPYLKKEHIQLLHNEETYVKQRYHAMVRAVLSNSNKIREKEAQYLGISVRHLRRLIKRYQDEGIPGLRNKSTRPNRSPYQTPTWLEDIVVKVREETGFGSEYVSQIVNISLGNQGKTERVLPRTVSRILVRRGVIESEKRAKKEYLRD